MGHRDAESAEGTKIESKNRISVFVHKRFSIGVLAVLVYVLLWGIGIALDALFQTHFLAPRKVFYTATRSLAMWLIPFTFVYMFVRRFALEKKRWGLWGFVLAIIACLLIPSSPPTYVEAAYILKDGRLAQLPQSATDVRAYSWSALFTGESFMMFRAAPDVIEKFIANSPSIRNAEPEHFNPKHMHLPYPDREMTSTSSTQYHENLNYDNEYFFRHRTCPSWYDPTIRVRGRKYEIPPDPKHGHNEGHMIIDDDKGIVYIWVIWS